MRRFLYVFSTLAFILSPVSAWASPKPCYFGWWPSHWTKLNFQKPYFEDGKTPHNTQWDQNGWKPEDWIVQSKDAMHLIQGFYKAKILTGQYVEDEIPVVEVGPNFYHLGGEDKRRVMQVIDNVYHVTTSRENGLFTVVDSETDETIGHYTKWGLQLQ